LKLHESCRFLNREPTERRTPEGGQQGVYEHEKTIPAAKERGWRPAKGCQCRDLRPPAFAMIDTVTRSPTNLSHTVGNLLPGGDRSSTMNAADSWLYETYVEIKA